MTTDHYAPVHTVSEQPIAKRNMRFYEQAHLRIGSLLLFSIAPQGFGQNIGADGCIDASVHTVSEQPMAQSNMRYHEQAHLRIVSLLLFSIDLQGFGRDILITRSARQFARVV
ncbi:hypothetical protein PsorP6_010704 [Peronosclerospora sorghi]|uniref:Uncharacterized protein n=1 Tax=Peronosclerospora sorghi TaxID=230839 RepID=A0ACC0VUM5_9STRA|nr:hypothetical protein PsorP6_010704 [Peronosclerospora sorghi]